MTINNYNDALKELEHKMKDLKNRQLAVMKRIKGKVDQKKIGLIKDKLKQYE